MERVVLITESERGIGLETAKLFQTKNWKVAATMRRPEDADDLKNIVDVACIHLDVTSIASVRSAVEETIERFGRIDAVVNNAGSSIVGPFEAATREQIERMFETNVFGVMNVCREVLPHLREQKRGVMVNVSPVGGRMTFPLCSVYHATRWAIEGFSESLQFELDQFNIRVKLIEHGAIQSDLDDDAGAITSREGLTAYDYLVARALPNLRRTAEAGPEGSVVAQVIYDAVTDGTRRLRYSVNYRGMLAARRVLPFALFNAIIKKAILR